MGGGYLRPREGLSFQSRGMGLSLETRPSVESQPTGGLSSNLVLWVTRSQPLRSGEVSVPKSMRIVPAEAVAFINT